ncbi:hypothetical protein [Rhodococcus wratislaviensis]|nr:hypothetical protein [Rhodococcus wratislaviensis]
MTASLLVDIERRIGDCRTLHSRIETACSLWTLSGYGLVQVHPDARDLFDARFPAVRTSIADFQAFLAGLLDRASMAPAVPQLRPQRLAETVTLSLQGIKSYTSSRDHRLDLIEALATAVYDSVVARPGLRAATGHTGIGADAPAEAVRGLPE